MENEWGCFKLGNSKVLPELRIIAQPMNALHLMIDPGCTKLLVVEVEKKWMDESQTESTEKDWNWNMRRKKS